MALDNLFEGRVPRERRSDCIPSEIGGAGLSFTFLEKESERKSSNLNMPTTAI